ncbi:aconitase X catalytic domain-containing protein [Lachnospiraceae bacterium OttesenSCG-928-E19]|nr:aconitase X catalytic domain-containing protein [Lachnospiraceae bacterium OttesenSCG-928-E19]
MRLSKEEQSMLDGSRGKGVQQAMEILVKMGELYGAERFLPVKNAHIDAAAYTTIWDAGTEFVEYLVENGAKVAVPTTINPVSRDIENWESLGTTKDFAMKSKKLEDAYLKLGVIPTWTCAPYQCTNVPQVGEVVSWSESNAVNYVNSVVGARAERLPDLVDVCCAVVGRVPEYGLYKEENRAGDMLFELEGFDDTWFQDSVDYAVLGYLVGELVINKVPVIKGLPVRTMPDDLKSFSAAAASGGAVALFHVVGMTPEAPDVETAFHGKKDYETIQITPKSMIEMENRLNSAEKEAVDLVLIGCPHLSFVEMKEVASLLKGKTVHEDTKFWIHTNRTVYDLLTRANLVKDIEDSGAKILRDTCLMEMECDGVWEGNHFVTNSGKAAQYAPAIAGVTITMADAKGCVEAALTGKCPKGRRTI